MLDDSLMTKTPYMRRLAAACLLALVAAMAASTNLYAAAAPAPDGEDGEAGAGVGNLIYFTLGPSFVTNYDGAGRLKYLKADVTVRIQPGTAPMLQRHLPYIRNRLVALFSAQLEENLTSVQGKEQLRAEALNEIKRSLDLLESPGASSQLINLYFTSFVVQR